MTDHLHEPVHTLDCAFPAGPCDCGGDPDADAPDELYLVGSHVHAFMVTLGACMAAVAVVSFVAGLVVRGML